MTSPTITFTSIIFSKLDKEIFNYVSAEYKQTVENEYKNFSIFAKVEPPMPKTKIKTSVKEQIGFIKEKETIL